MDKIAVITDSCADLLQDTLKEENLYVLPMIITCNDGQYKDGIDIYATDVYKRLETEVPKTSTPAGDDIIKVFEDIKSKGYNKVIAIVLAGALSGTYNQIRLIAGDYEDIEVAVYDSKTASIGYGVAVMEALNNIKAGASFEKIKSQIEYMLANTSIYFALNTL